MIHQKAWKLALATLLIVAAAGCAAQSAYRDAELDAKRGNWDRAVLGYSKALALDPGNTRYNVALERAKLKSSAQHFEKGKRYAASSQWELAVAEYQQTLLLNPGNQHAATELERATVQLRRRQEGPSELQRLKDKARRDQLAPPRLNPKSNVAILLQFRDQPVGKIFEALSKASQINFIYDEKTDLQKPLTIDVGNVTVEKALDILMLQTKNFYKVIDESTLLIAPDQRQKRQELEDQVIRTFYLSNAETKTIVSVLRTLLNARQIAENDGLNSISIKETPDKVAIAEKIVEANDKSKGEIIIDVELLEINRKIIQNLGIDLSSKSLSLTFLDGKSSVPLNNLSTLRQQGNWTVGPIPSVVINFLKSDGDSKTIAKPQLRVSEGEKASILIGDRVPIPTTSFNTSQTVGGNIVPITSFTYQNVGITVQLEPRVHHNKEVTLKVKVEVSQLAGSVSAGGGVDQPIIGTREIETVIRLRDGETNLLAGLIRREETELRTGVPGLMDTPGIGRVLSNTKIDTNETDIVLTLTPYIIRIPDITEDDLQTLWVGTDENMRLRGPVRGVLGVSPFAEDEGQPASEAPPIPIGGEPSLPTPTGYTPTPAPATPTPSTPSPAPTPPPTGGGAETPGVPVPVPVPGEGGEVENPPVEEPPPVDESPEPSGGERPDQPQGPAVVRLVPSSPSFRVGDRVIVEVRVDNAGNVGSVPFHLQYNRQVLEFVGPALEGPFLSSDGTNTVFLATPTQGGGDVVVGASRLGGGSGVSGSGTIATFQFQAINPGDCGFSFTGASVKDPQARNLPASFLSAPVAVEP
ncbi:MAG TPA: cohesin domain-containing protein [Candidatus Polarisedimenticolaceae bacterium]